MMLIRNQDQIVHNNNNIEYALKEDMDNICRWFTDNKLKLNVGKTKFLVVCPGRMCESFQNINVFVRGVHIEREPQIKIPGGST